MSLGLWIGLILCNVAWAVNPVVGKVLIGELGPEFAAWTKYASAFCVYLLYLLLSAARGTRREAFARPRSRADWVGLGAIGLATFFLAPLTHMVGLDASTAVSNSLLVALEPLFTVFFGWLILRESLSWRQLLCFALALAGFSMISGIASPGAWGAGPRGISTGDIILLVAVAGEALYSVYAKELLRRHAGTAIYGSAMAVGLLLLTPVIFLGKGLPPLALLSLRGWLAVLWMGTLGTVLTYLFWLHALKRDLPLASVVLTLFLQPVIGAAAGILFLGEHMSGAQLLGGTLILVAVVVQAVGTRPLAEMRLRLFS